MRTPFITAALCALVYSAGCQPETRRITPDCDVYFPYAGAYRSVVEGKSGDTEWTDEFDVVVQQNGPALSVSNVLALADSEGLTFNHEYTTLDYFVNGGEPVVVQFDGGSRAGDPYVLDLEFGVDYPFLDGWSYTVTYVITLGEPVDYLAQRAVARDFEPMLAR